MFIHKSVFFENYYLGGKQIGPLITAISYSASNSSAWTLLGVSGIAYKFGVSTIWLVIGVIVGMFFNWLIVAPTLFRMTRSKDLITIPQFLVNEYQEKEKKPILLLSSIIIIFFLIILTVVVGRTMIGKHFQKKFSKRPPPGIIVTEVVKYKFSEKIESYGTAIPKKTQSFRIKKNDT